MRKKYVPVGEPAEGKEFTGPIVVGTGMTEIIGSDRHAYEVVEVRDQKHITVRPLDHVHVGDGEMDNSWELWSDTDRPTSDMIRVGDLWYWTSTITDEDLPAIEARDPKCGLTLLSVHGWDIEKIRKGRQTRRWKASVYFGRARYYYCYEF